MYGNRWWRQQLIIKLWLIVRSPGLFLFLLWCDHRWERRSYKLNWEVWWCQLTWETLAAYMKSWNIDYVLNIFYKPGVLNIILLKAIGRTTTRGFIEWWSQDYGYTARLYTSSHLKSFLEPAVPPIRLFLVINMMPLKRCVVKGNHFTALLRNEARNKFLMSGPWLSVAKLRPLSFAAARWGCLYLLL
jgi:hypothetical protein